MPLCLMKKQQTKKKIVDAVDAWCKGKKWTEDLMK